MYIAFYITWTPYAVASSSYEAYYDGVDDAHIAIDLHSLQYPTTPSGTILLTYNDTLPLPAPDDIALIALFYVEDTCLLIDTCSHSSILGIGDTYTLYDDMSLFVGGDTSLSDVFHFSYTLVPTVSYTIGESDTFSIERDTISLTDTPFILQDILILPLENFDFVRDISLEDGAITLSDFITTIYSVYLLSSLSYADEHPTSKHVLNYRDLLSLLDSSTHNLQTYSIITDYLTIRDILHYLSQVDINPISILLDLTIPEKTQLSFFTFNNTVISLNTIFAMPDGLYTFDASSTEETVPTSILINISNMLTSRVKRVDKIYSNTNIGSSIIYADNNKYVVNSNNTMVSIPKGIKAKDLQIALNDMDTVEFIEVDVLAERNYK